MKAHALADVDGMSGDEATAAARRRLGSPLRLREQSRDPWVFATVDTFAKGVGHALRLLRRDPAFTFASLATLALGIGLTTTIFSVAYGVLWRPLPYPNSDRLVVVSSAQQTERGPRTFWNWAPSSATGCGAQRSMPIRRSSDSRSPSPAFPGPSSACCRQTSASGRWSAAVRYRNRTSSSPIAGPVTKAATRSSSWWAA